MDKFPSSRTDTQRMGALELETVALRELLFRRQAGGFVRAEQMVVRLAGMVARKRRELGVLS